MNSNSDGSSQSSGPSSPEKKDQQLSGSSTGPVSPKPQSTEPDKPKPQSTEPDNPKPQSTEPDNPKPQPKSNEEKIQEMVLGSGSGGRVSSSPQQPQPINGTEGRPDPFREAAASQSLDEQEQKQQQQQQQQQQVSEPDRSPSTPSLGSKDP